MREPKGPAAIPKPTFPQNLPQGNVTFRTLTRPQLSSNCALLIAKPPPHMKEVLPSSSEEN